MKLFFSDQIKQLDAKTIEYEPISSTDLMERAACACYDVIMCNYSDSSSFTIFAGTGNNGGDALVIARKLVEAGKIVKVFVIKYSEHLSEDFKINYIRLEELNVDITELTGFDCKELVVGKNSVIIDGIFGSGLTRPVTGWLADIIDLINMSELTVISIDAPSGLFGEDNKSVLNNSKARVVNADLVLALEQPSLSLMFAENYDFVSKFTIVPIGLSNKAKAEIDTDYQMITNEYVKELLKVRSPYSHKGTFGNVLVVAGKYGMMGAATLCAKSAYRAGSGLVTLHVPAKCVDIAQVTVPEAIMCIDESDYIFTGITDIERFSAIAVGPGLGCKPNTIKGVIELLKCNKKIVIDADALNILSEEENWEAIIPESAILTPHPKELERLFGTFTDSYSRVVYLKKWCKDRRVAIVIKGAYTTVIDNNGKVYINTTGNSGMASGGSGDVLSGIIVSLLGQNYSVSEAACIGVYIHGLSADIALNVQSEESMIASDIIENIGSAFKYMRNDEI